MTTFRIIKPSLIVINLTFMSLGPIIAIIIFYFNINSWYIYSPIIILMFGSFSFVFHHCIIKRIIINQDGLEYRTLFKCVKRTWVEIKFIGITYYPYKYTGAPLWIYFTDNCTSEGVFASSKAFVKVHYRKKIICEISKYWPNEIAGLYMITNKN